MTFRTTRIALAAFISVAVTALPSLAAVEISGVQGTMLGTDNGIVLVNIQTKAKTTIVSRDTMNRITGGNGDQFQLPRFSPDGKQVVFWHNWWLADWSAKAPGAMYVADNNGRNITRICDAHVDHAGIDYQSLSWCTDGYIYFSRQTDTILRVNPNTKVVENYWSAVGVSGYKTGSEGYGPYVENLVVSRDGTRGVSSNGGKVHGLDLVNKRLLISCGGGCRGSITTNGDQIVHWLTCCGYYPPPYTGDNAFLRITVFQTMTSCDSGLSYMYAPGSADGPNPSADQYWMYRGACNSNDYLAGCGYGNSNGVLQNKNTSDYLIIPSYTATDFWLGALPEPPTPTPRIALDSSSLTFVSTGGSVPASKTVRVSNSGSGTLTNVTVTESAAWLTVTRSGSGNSQTLTNTVNPAGLANGAYNTTVTVSGGGASNTASYTVTLNVGSAVAAPTNLTASPGTAALSASLLWQDNANNEAGYVVQRQPSGGAWAQVRSLPANTVSWTDTGLAAGTYNYRVRAYAGSDSSAWSNTAGVTIAAVVTITVTSPSAGQALTGGSVHTIRWTATNSAGVYIEWSADDGDVWALAPVNGSIRPGDPNWGAYAWTVPDTQSSQCRVRVVEYTNHDVWAVSPLFSITHSTGVGRGPAALPRSVRRQLPARLVDMRGRLVSAQAAGASMPRAATVRNCGEFGIVVGTAPARP